MTAHCPPFAGGSNDVSGASTNAHCYISLVSADGNQSRYQCNPVLRFIVMVGGLQLMFTNKA